MLNWRSADQAPTKQERQFGLIVRLYHPISGTHSTASARFWRVKSKCFFGPKDSLLPIQFADFGAVVLAWAPAHEAKAEAA